MTILDARVPAERPTEVDGSAVATLRRQRQELMAEDRRCAHLRRLLRARLDLTVAEAVEVPALTCVPLTGPVASPPTVGVLVLAALRGTGRGDLGSRLQDLDVALRQLSSYSDALRSEIDDATKLLVEALAADPSSCLGGPGRPAVDEATA